MWIELIMNMSGTRANGDRYPPAWTSFEVADWEGEHLVKGGMARPVPTPAGQSKSLRDDAPVPVMPAPVSQPSSTGAGPKAPEPAKADAEPVKDEPEPEDVPSPPAPNDSKSAWVDYAVSRGMSGDEASRATKAELQGRYGSRL